MSTEKEEKDMVIKRGQIWVRRPTENLETWTVRVEVVSENSVAFIIVDFEGEQPEGTLMAMKKEKFQKLYKFKPTKGKHAKDSEESE